MRNDEREAGKGAISQMPKTPSGKIVSARRYQHQRALTNLPGLEYAAQTLIGLINAQRAELHLSELVLMEDPAAVKARRQALREMSAREKRRSEASRKKKAEADAVRQRIRDRETKTAEAEQLAAFKRKLKKGEL